MMWFPSSTGGKSMGGGTSSEHQGWSPSIEVQVSNNLPLKENGKEQLPQPSNVG